MLETLDYFLVPAVPFGFVIWLMWYLFRDEIREEMSDRD